MDNDNPFVMSSVNQKSRANLQNPWILAEPAKWISWLFDAETEQ